jgi:aminopeptidase YwaD
MGPSFSPRRLVLAFCLLAAGCQSSSEAGSTATIVATASVPTAIEAAPARGADTPTVAASPAATAALQPALQASPQPAFAPSGSPAAAPAIPTNAAGFSGERAYQDVQALSEQIGSRVAGAPAQDLAADYIAQQLQAAGLDVERQPFTFTAFQDRGSSLEVLTPERFTVQTRTLAYSGSGALQGELVDVGLARPGDFDPASVQGRIALAKRGETQFREKVATLASAGASGVIIANNASGNFSGSLGASAGLPTVSVSMEDGEQLARLAARGPTSVSLTVSVEIAERTALNVIGNRPGTNGTIVIGGHFDSVAAGPGANDNASGTATVLELARATAARDYPFALRFVAFGAEEVGLLGSAHYVRQLSAAERAATFAMLNLDMVGVGDRVQFGGDAELVERATRLAAERGVRAGQLRGGAGSGSDHASFLAAGVPALFVYRGEDPNYHTASDRAEFVRPEHLASAGELVLAVLEELARDRP